MNCLWRATGDLACEGTNEGFTNPKNDIPHVGEFKVMGHEGRQCLDAGWTKQKDKVTMKNCINNPNVQNFTYDNDTNQIKLARTNLCVDDGGWNTTKPTDFFHLWECDSTNSNQKFTYDKEKQQLKSVKGLCVSHERDTEDKNGDGPRKLNLKYCDTYDLKQLLYTEQTEHDKRVAESEPDFILKSKFSLYNNKKCAHGGDGTQKSKIK
jgi:hypothetical protein